LNELLFLKSSNCSSSSLLTKCCCGNEIDVDKRGGAHNMHERKINCTQFLWKPVAKRYFRISRRKEGDDGTKTDFKEMRCENVD
jgi:hypothetical protein